MKNKRQPMGELQKKAILTLAICLTVFLITVLAVVVVLNKTSVPKVEEEVINEEYSKDAYVLNQESVAIAQEAEPVDLSDVLFIGDSNTVRMNNYGLITYQQAAAKVGVGIRAVSADAFLYFEEDDRAHTIVDSLRLGLLNPTHIIVCLGTNDVGGMNVLEFIDYYKSALSALRLSSAYADISVAAILPIPTDHSKYPEMKQLAIDQFNQALLDMCEEEGYTFLNSNEVLKGDNGFGKAEYYDKGDIHMTMEGLEALYKYYATHLGEITDRRPTDRYQVRVEPPVSAQEGTSELGRPGGNANPVPLESLKPTASPDAKAFKANYYAEEGGLVQFGEQKSASLSFDVAPSDKITVTAVPKNGYYFVKWSDGITTAERTDSGFTKTTSATAMFDKSKVELTLDKTTASIKKDEKLTLKATIKVNGEAKDASVVRWIISDVQKGEGATFEFVGGEVEKITIIALAVYNGEGLPPAQCVVTVEQPKKEIRLSLDTNRLTLKQNSTDVVSANVTNAADSDIKWSWKHGEGSGKTFTVNATGVNPGEYVLTATVGDKTAQCTIEVKEADSAPAPEGGSQEGAGGEGGSQEGAGGEGGEQQS